MQKQGKKKVLKVNFDMIQSDKDFYLNNCNFNETQEKHSDINKDNQVTIGDVTSLQRYLAGYGV